MTKTELQQVINDVELDLITIVFVTLKLCGVIHWNWFCVFLPAIFEFVLHVGLLLLNRGRYK